jgi:hypothetical protein
MNCNLCDELLVGRVVRGKHSTGNNYWCLDCAVEVKALPRHKYSGFSNVHACNNCLKSANHVWYSGPAGQEVCGNCNKALGFDPSFTKHYECVDSKEGPVTLQVALDGRTMYPCQSCLPSVMQYLNDLYGEVTLWATFPKREWKR